MTKEEYKRSVEEQANEEIRQIKEKAAAKREEGEEEEAGNTNRAGVSRSFGSADCGSKWLCSVTAVVETKGQP